MEGYLFVRAFWLIIELLELWGFQPTRRRLAKLRSRGLISAHTCVASGTVPGLKPFWESKTRWRVEEGRLARRDEAIAVRAVDVAGRVPTAVEEQVLGTSASAHRVRVPFGDEPFGEGPPLRIVTVRTDDAAIEIALDPADERWFRERLMGARDAAALGGA
ncbi:hypothetical protein [Demequina subtropica]|uniref:hypothetical protein n=1 Tax=Demequina subtropica TaxID=1638989 RepID=UPI000785A88E|nr:hypothetical protein [Demequina subtropica]